MSDATPPSPGPNLQGQLENSYIQVFNSKYTVYRINNGRYIFDITSIRKQEMNVGKSCIFL